MPRSGLKREEGEPEGHVGQRRARTTRCEASLSSLPPFSPVLAVSIRGTSAPATPAPSCLKHTAKAICGQKKEGETELVRPCGPCLLPACSRMQRPSDPVLFFLEGNSDSDRSWGSRRSTSKGPVGAYEKGTGSAVQTANRRHLNGPRGQHTAKGRRAGGQEMRK
ncbi:unnamed protein product [Bursaphelenchus okinawaensis]|uniref:Uncharacterized protein n=1 Tax=Bursaphelenchus okinawaensis TaxID=465554 RepID=A0A811L4Z0_9BILA|nr:unnamed protein product [Bursaphelenchus okinawaensis]CAG9119761.1 unnamed protein product [Bursaphelenchus okinawaensis]